MQITKLFENNNIEIINTQLKGPLFYGIQIGTLLDYKLPRKAILTHVWESNKLTMAQLKEILPTFETKKPDNTILITEQGLYQLLFQSKMEEAIKFQKWVFDVITEIRKTGEYKLPKPQNNQLMLLNEQDLHIKTVAFIQKKFPHALVICSLGEFQDTEQKRIIGKMKGYHAGCTDIQILNSNDKYIGMAIEFKSPLTGGVVSDKQHDFLKRIAALKYKTVCSSSYDDIIYEICEYFKTVKIHCDHCEASFKNRTLLDKHIEKDHPDI